MLPSSRLEQLRPKQGLSRHCLPLPPSPLQRVLQRLRVPIEAEGAPPGAQLAVGLQPIAKPPAVEHVLHNPERGRGRG
eukprot:9155975-Lingulodinium_polyedra.AAC.1